MEEVLYGASLRQKLGVGEDLVAYSRLDVMPVHISTKTLSGGIRVADPDPNKTCSIRIQVLKFL
jgi:hypothetical protein